MQRQTNVSQFNPTKKALDFDFDHSSKMLVDTDESSRVAEGSKICETPYVPLPFIAVQALPSHQHGICSVASAHFLAKPGLEGQNLQALQILR
jgi:hypothetical protein